MQKVFISYSWKDEAIALRLYRDLQNINASVWIDRIDGEPAADFQNEFLRIIACCSCFIVIDSNNYRHKSNWCEKELKACFERIDSGDKVSLIVCLAEEDGTWRKISFASGQATNLTFERLNRLKYLPLFHHGRYDNEQSYISTLEAICRILGKDSYSWDIFPEEADLTDELDYAARDNHAANDDDYLALKWLLRTIAIRRKQQKDISRHLTLLIEDCEELKLNIFLPRWINALWLADKRHNHRHDSECFECLKSLANDFPSESRTYRALGSLSARMGRQELAEANFLKALSLIDSSNESGRNAEYETLCNLGQIYMNMRKYQSAKVTLEKALAFLGHDDLNVCLAQNYYECLLHINETVQAGKFILQMVGDHPTVPEFQEYYGCYCMKYLNARTALPHLRNAYLMKPCSEFTYALLNCLLICGDSGEYNKLRTRSIPESQSKDEDEYWNARIRRLPTAI